MSTIGLSMIVRDEAVDRLALLIDFLSPVIKEAVIVDTGSELVDADEPLYQSWGVKTARIPWESDFSAARNATLEHLTTDWVLALDADEMPSLGMVEHLQKVKGKGLGRTKGYLYLTRNFWAGERGIEVEAHWHCRLFQRLSGRWYRPLHELVELDGLPESKTRGTSVLRKAPRTSYLIHSKGRTEIERSAALYKAMEQA